MRNKHLAHLIEDMNNGLQVRTEVKKKTKFSFKMLILIDLAMSVTYFTVQSIASQLFK